MKKETKTNAMRILEKNKIDFKEYLYDCEEFINGVAIAEKLNLPPEKTFKTLVTIGKSRNYFVFVIPVAKDLDLKAAAASVSEKSVEMIPVKDITSVTGYIRGGCSPIGMKKQFKTVFDSSAKEFDTISFSGGRRGVQIEASPIAVAKLINAEFADITR